MALWIIWLIMGVVGLGSFAALIIPKIIYRTQAALLPIRSKAVDRTSDEFGETVTYVPSATARQYIRRYSVGRDEEGVFFVGELVGKAAYLNYELTVYGADNEVLERLRVEEKFNDSGKTSVVRLSEKTDYVLVRILCVDDDPIPRERRKVGARYILWLAALCASLVVTTDLLVWLITSFILRCEDHFTMTLTLPASSWAALLGFTALGVTLLTCCFSLGSLLVQKRGDGDEK